MNKKKSLTILGIIGLVVITLGVTYAFFNYAKQGTTENNITTGTIEFLYTEVNQVGAGISIEDALPTTDAVGKAQTGAGNVFNFKVMAKAVGKVDIPYEVTARKKTSSTLDEEAVKLYLTEVNGSIEEERLLANYNTLTQTTKTVPEGIVEKTIYTGYVPTGSTGYEKNFRLRMWLDNDVDFSSGNYNGKSFTLTVNVYANAKTVTTEEIDMANTTRIDTVTVNNSQVTKVEDEAYDYEINVQNEVNEIALEIETTNDDATVEVTKLDSIALANTNIKRMASTKSINLTLGEGDNYFNIKVISANKQVENEYILKISKRQYSLDNTTYVAGSSLTWAGYNWKVIKDNGKSVDLILTNNYATGIYGSTTDFTTSTAKTKIDTDFLNSNVTLITAKEEGTITYNETTSSYARLPYNTELSTNIPNESSTPFWTMSANGSNLYLGSSTGIQAINYIQQTAGTYYEGYSTALANIQKSAPITVTSENLTSAPSVSSVTYNASKTTLTKSSTYRARTNITDANASGYGCSGNQRCPNAYCVNNSENYYGSSCTVAGLYTYYSLGSWEGHPGSTCGSNTIYAANGNCKTYYQLNSTTSNIGYRPVVNVLKK